MIRYRNLVLAGLALALGGPAPASTREDEAPRPTLELSLEDAVDRALRNNLDIAIERLGPQAEEKAVEELEAAYTPLFTADLAQRSRTDPPTTALIGGERVGTDAFDMGAEKALRSGGRLRLEFDNTRARTGASSPPSAPRSSPAWA
jgi:outer membrane protein TolC